MRNATRKAAGSLEAEARRKLVERMRSLTARREAAEHASQELLETPEPDWEDRAAAVSAARGLTQLAESERAQLAMVMAALDRLDEGTWGWCVGCGQPIDDKRLRALPETARCAQCTNHR
jgi:RNA polymerase-binding transcription factor DksA